MPNTASLRVKAVLEISGGDTISVDVVGNSSASFDCVSVQDAIRGLISRHSKAGISEIVVWNRLAPDSIDDIVACVRDLGCEVISEHDEHVRFRLSAG
jgi:hypothetical protein